jgi:hypothetical protein
MCGNREGKCWVHPFFHKNLSPGTYIALKDLNENSTLLKSFY